MTAAALLLLLLGPSQDSVRVQAGLSRAEVHVGETTVLRVDVETGGARAEIGRLTRLPPGLELASTRDYDQRQFSIPGGTRRFVTREFVLRARAPGAFRIPSVDVTVEGRAYATTSQRVTVSDPPPGLRPPSGAGEPESGVALHAWLDADTAYVGEQVTMHAEALFSQPARLRLRRAPEYEAPNPSGFWIHDLPERRSATTRVVDGEVYEVQAFRRALFPLTPGLHAVPPARLEYEMRRGILYAPETFEVVTDSMPLVVLPVPERGRPPEYTGAVGRYTASGTLEPREVPAGEAAVLTLEVDGVGNVRALPPPRLPPLGGAEVFPPTEDSETRTEGADVGGWKRFSWVVIPREPGTLEIPPIAYPYFDPDAREFRVADVPGMTLDVTPGGGVAATPAAPPTLRYLKTEPAGPDPLGWVHTPWFALAQLLPLLALGVGWAASRQGGGLSRRELRRRRRAGMKELARRVDDGDRGLLSDAEAFARSWVTERTGVRPGDAGRKAPLISAGVPDATATAVARALERMATARYAPAAPGPESLRSMMGQLASALERLDRDAPLPAGHPSPKRAPGARGAGVGAVVLLAGMAAAAGAQAEAVSPGREGETARFAEGLALFEDGRYAEAADAFDAYVRGARSDPAGWYNLGTSYYRAGHPGYAVWAWLHVPRLDPRDADTRHNLSVAGVPPELVRRVAPPLPLRPVELALLAAVAWLVAGAAGGWWLATGGRRRGVVASVALVLAVGLGAAWLASTLRPETLILLERVTLRAGPTLAAEPVDALEAGTGLVPVAAYGDWRRVRTLGGTEGWIENRSAGAL